MAWSGRSPPIRWSSRSAGIGYRVFVSPSVISTATAGRPAAAPHVPPRPRGPAGAVRLPDVRGARVLQPAADGDRGRAQGRDGDRGLAADRRPPARDPAAGPGGAGVDPGHRQEAGRADHLRAQGEGVRGGRGGRLRGRVERVEGEVVGTAGPRLLAGRGARGVAAGAQRPAVGAGLEERVKAALRTLLGTRLACRASPRRALPSRRLLTGCASGCPRPCSRGRSWRPTATWSSSRPGRRRITCSGRSAGRARRAAAGAQRRPRAVKAREGDVVDRGYRPDGTWSCAASHGHGHVGRSPR